MATGRRRAVTVPGTEPDGQRFVHSALFYRSQREYLDFVERFVAHGLAMDEAVLIADRIVVMKAGRVYEIMTVPLQRPRPDLGLVRGMPEFAETRYKVWRALHDDATVVH